MQLYQFAVAREFKLGCATFGARFVRRPQRESNKQFEELYRCGGNFLNTSDAYQSGESKKIIGEFIALRQNDFILHSKFAGRFNFIRDEQYTTKHY